MWGIARMTKCKICIPSIFYKCAEHRDPHQCVGCLRTDKPLFMSGIGILCKDCQRRHGSVLNNR